jgi:hypothetical protein
MKKRLEADLISIAHRILQLKSKSDINQLFLETQKLYEKLSVLRFVEEQYGEAKPTIGQAAIVSDIENFYDNEATIESKIATLIEENSIEETPAEEPIAEEVIVTEEISTVIPEEVEPIKEEITATEEKEIEVTPIVSAIIEEKEEKIAEEITATEKKEIEVAPIISPIIEEKAEEINATEKKEIEEEIIAEEKPKPITPPAFTPHFSLIDDIDEKKTEIVIPKKAESIQISFEDLLGGKYSEPQFVKVDEIPAIPRTPIFEKVNNTTTIEEVSTSTKTQIIVEKPSPKVVSLNDKLSKGIDIDLNDQIAFVKHLFGNSIEDYNRVLSQIITFDNFYETKAFIEEMVKPDYNDWKGKTDYEDRFMDIIEKKFL